MADTFINGVALVNNPPTPVQKIVSPKKPTLPPGAGSFPINPGQMALGWYQNRANVFYNPDEAIITDRLAAEVMLHDLNITDPLNTRQLATALLPWHIEPEDKTDTGQLEVANCIQKIIASCPELTKLFMECLWAIWYGSGGSQLSYEYKFRYGRRCLVPTAHYPVHGDSVRWSYKNPGQVGIQIYIGQVQGDASRNLDWLPSDIGPTHILTDKDRDNFIIHRHQLMGYSYFEPLKAGLSQGIGLRNYIWWTYRTKQQVLASLAQYIQRFGAGLFWANYPVGDETFQAAAQEALRTFTEDTIIAWPVSPQGEDLGGIHHDPPDSAGIENYLKLINYYNAQIRRYISGVDTQADDKSTQFGEDLTDANAFARIARFDSLNLSDTLTHQLVRVIQRWTFPETYDKFACRFVFSSDRPDPASFMQAVQLAWSMGIELDGDQIRNELRLSKPHEGSDIIKKPDEGQGEEQGNGYNPFSGEEKNAKAQLPTPGRSEGDWVEERGPRGGTRRHNYLTGAIRYSADEQDPGIDPEPETYAAEDWTEEKAPRAKSGKRWRNTKTGTITYTDPTKKKEKSPGKAPDATKEATIAWSTKDAKALSNIKDKLQQAKGKRGGLGVKGLQDIAKVLGLKGAGKLKKDQLIDHLLDKLTAAKKEDNYDDRLKKLKRNEDISGLKFEDRVINGLIANLSLGDEYRDALQDLIKRGDKAPTSSKVLVDRVHNKVKEDLKEGKITDEELAPILKGLADSNQGSLSTEEFNGLVQGVERKKPKQESNNILPDELKLEPLPKTRKPKAPPKPKIKGYSDKLKEPYRGRFDEIKEREKDTGVRFNDRLLTDLISSGQFHPDFDVGKYKDIVGKQSSGLRITADEGHYLDKARQSVQNQIYNDKIKPEDIGESLERLSDQGYGTISQIEYDNILNKGLIERKEFAKEEESRLDKFKEHLAELEDPRAWLEFFALAWEEQAPNPFGVADRLYAEEEGEGE